MCGGDISCRKCGRLHQAHICWQVCSSERARAVIRWSLWETFQNRYLACWGHLGTLNILWCDCLCIRNEFMTKDILSNCQVDGIVREPGMNTPWIVTPRAWGCWDQKAVPFSDLKGGFFQNVNCNCQKYTRMYLWNLQSLYNFYKGEVIWYLRTKTPMRKTKLYIGSGINHEIFIWSSTMFSSSVKLSMGSNIQTEGVLSKFKQHKL